MPATTREMRAACPTDAERLREIACAAYGLYLPRMDRPPAPMLADYAALIAAGQVEVLQVADAATEATTDVPLVAGFLVAFPREADYFVENVAVAPDCQGAGHGRFLMTAAETHAKAAGRDSLRLYTNEVMTENLAFYESLGFSVEERRLEDGYRRVFFIKQL